MIVTILIETINYIIDWQRDKRLIHGGGGVSFNQLNLLVYTLMNSGSLVLEIQVQYTVLIM